LGERWLVPSILLVQGHVRSFLKALLTGAGYDVRGARNGAEVLRACRELLPDLVITELIMPEKEGLETIRELRRDYPEVRIIAIAGGRRKLPQEYLAAAEQFGARRALSKPFSSDEILRAVDEVLKEA
jgi:CheY-like chemotaxis protein